jgi:cell wall-associated NlpC family hydrolase
MAAARLDRRITPARPDLALESLRGLVEAERFVAGEVARVTVPSAPLRRTPSPDGAIDTEALAGEAVLVIERKAGFAWVQLQNDSYVGYLDERALGVEAGAEASVPTHRIGVTRTFLYPGPSMKLPPLAHYGMGAMVGCLREEGDFALVSTGAGEGFIWRSHLRPLGEWEADPVSVAEGLAGVPYLWGGKTSLGLDCSGLVQLAHAQCGNPLPRDSDMQEAGVGEAVPVTPGLSGLRRGDLVFWKGHVGLMRDAVTLLHANGHHMLVVSEPLAEAAARILAKGGGPVTAVRRP